MMIMVRSQLHDPVTGRRWIEPTFIEVNSALELKAVVKALLAEQASSQTDGDAPEDAQ